MKINKSNFEIYFIDYHDGNLSAEEIAELFLFLEENPDLKTEFENFSPLTLDAPEITFPERETLRRGEINFVNIQTYLVASLEGDLTQEEEELLEGFLLQYPQYRQDAVLYSKTISVPDPAVIYPDKKSLKQPVPMFVAYKREFRIAIAAILLISIFAGSVAIFNRVMEQPQERIAGQKPVINPAPAGNAPGTTVEVNKNPVAGITRVDSVTVNVESEKMSKSIIRERIREQEHTAALKSGDTLSDQLLMADAIRPELLPNGLPVMQPAVKAASEQPVTANTNENYMSVWEAVRSSSEKSIRKALGKEEEVLAYADEPQDSKIRLVDVVSKGMEKLSNEKVQMNAGYDNEKQSNTFSFSVGKFKIEKK